MTRDTRNSQHQTNNRNQTNKMKTTTRLISSIIAVTILLAGGIASAQTSLANPKDHGANLFFTIGPTWLNAKSDYGNTNLYGATGAFGWRINKNNKIEIDIGVLGGTESEPYFSIDYVTSMELFTYSYCIPLDTKGSWEIRLSPSAGLAYIYTKFDSAYMWATDAAITFAAGGGAGVTFHTSNRFQLDLGYRYMRVGRTSYNWGELGALDTNSVTFSAGWKF